MRDLSPSEDWLHNSIHQRVISIIMASKSGQRVERWEFGLVTVATYVSVPAVTGFRRL